MENYNIVIPSAVGDIDFIPCVITYVRKNIIGCDKIFVITNEKGIERAKRWNGLLSDVTILDENKLLDGLTFQKVKQYLYQKRWYVRQGWYFQQFLKMGFALTDYAGEYYMAWDADTLPLSKLGFIEDNHPLFTIKKEFHSAYFDTMKKLIGLDKSVDYSFIAEHMLFKTSIMILTSLDLKKRLMLKKLLVKNLKLICFVIQ